MGGLTNHVLVIVDGSEAAKRAVVEGEAMATEHDALLSSRDAEPTGSGRRPGRWAPTSCSCPRTGRSGAASSGGCGEGSPRA